MTTLGAPAGLSELQQLYACWGGGRWPPNELLFGTAAAVLCPVLRLERDCLGTSESTAGFVACTGIGEPRTTGTLAVCSDRLGSSFEPIGHTHHPAGFP